MSKRTGLTIVVLAAVLSILAVAHAQAAAEADQPPQAGGYVVPADHLGPEKSESVVAPITRGVVYYSFNYGVLLLLHLVAASWALIYLIKHRYTTTLAVMAALFVACAAAAYFLGTDKVLTAMAFCIVIALVFSVLPSWTVWVRKRADGSEEIAKEYDDSRARVSIAVTAGVLYVPFAILGIASKVTLVGGVLLTAILIAVVLVGWRLARATPAEVL